MNEDEVLVLIGESDLFVVLDKVLDWVDLVLCIVGLVGLFMVGYIEDFVKCEMLLLLLLGLVLEFNCYEFSCFVCKESCINFICVYLYILLYMGGLEKIKNINGVGDVVLFVLLYDMVVNKYYKENVFNLSKY